MKFVIACLVAVAAAAQDRCCESCPEGKNKYHSVDNLIGHCGESCISDGDYWKFKPFEPTLTKSEDNTPCANRGWTTYWETQTHGIPIILDVTVDLFNRPGKFTTNQKKEETSESDSSNSGEPTFMN